MEQVSKHMSPEDFKAATQWIESFKSNPDGSGAIEFDIKFDE